MTGQNLIIIGVSHLDSRSVLYLSLAGVVLLTSCTNLESLNLTNIPLLTDESICPLLSLPRLSSLSVARCEKLTDRFLYSLADQASALASLDVRRDWFSRSAFIPLTVCS